MNIPGTISKWIQVPFADLSNLNVRSLPLTRDFRVASFAEALAHKKVLMCDGVCGARNACHVRTDDVNIPY